MESILAMDIISNFEQINLQLHSTLQELKLWEVETEVDNLGCTLAKAFEEEPLMPGMILTKNKSYLGMISRRGFFELMSRPYSLGLFAERPIENLYNSLQPEFLIFHESTPIITATQISLQRKADLVYEPIVVRSESGKYRILDIQQLLLTYSQIQLLTLDQLKKTQEQSKNLQTDLREIQQNYLEIVQNERMFFLEQFLTTIPQEINNPINSIAGNLIRTTRYIHELLEVISLYQRHYPKPIVEIETVLNKTKLDFLMADLPKLFASMKVSTNNIQQFVRSLRNFFSLDKSEKKAVDIHEGIDNSLLILQSSLKSKFALDSINIIKEYGDIPEVECYPGQLNQVFLNILSYIINILQEGNRQDKQVPIPTISIRTEALSTDRVIIRIADNGVGMTDEIRQRIFTASLTQKAADQKLDYCLPISYQIVVEEHFGQLQCISAPRQGTEFVITLPIKQEMICG
jgi:signal transduction histidine kinase